MNNTNNKEIKNNNELALFGFVFSLTGCLAVPGLILSIIGLATAKKYKKQRKELAIAGLIISAFIIVFSIGLFISNTINSYEDSSSYDYKTEEQEEQEETKKTVEVIDFSSKTKEEINSWCSENNITCTFETEYSDTVAKDAFISQDVEAGKKIAYGETIKIVYSLGHKKTAAEIEAEYKAGCESLDYREVLRSPSNYADRKVHWFGKVSQVVSSGTIKKYMIYVNCSENSYASGGYICDDPLYVVYYGNTNLIEDDIVEIWGTMASDAYTYTTVLGASKTVPQVDAEYVLIR